MAKRRGEGLRVRLARIPGETPKDVLRSPLYLPATLSGFGWTEAFSHSEYDTVSDGQHSQPAMGPATARQLRTTDDVQTLTVDWDPKWFVDRGRDPDDVRSELFAIGRARKAVEMLASLKLDEAPLLRMNITVRSIRTELRPGEPDALYFTLSISEWRPESAERRGQGSRGDRLPTTHVLTAEDSWHSLSLRYYHSATPWRVIAGANGLTSWGQSTPVVKSSRFKVGDKVKIPKLVSGQGGFAGVAWAQRHGLST